MVSGYLSKGTSADPLPPLTFDIEGSPVYLVREILYSRFRSTLWTGGIHLKEDNHMTPISIHRPLITNHPHLSAIHKLPERSWTSTHTLCKVLLKQSCLCDSKRLISLLLFMFFDPQPIQVFEYCLVCLKIACLTLCLVLITILDLPLFAWLLCSFQ